MKNNTQALDYLSRAYEIFLSHYGKAYTLTQRALKEIQDLNFNWFQIKLTVLNGILK